MIVMPSFISDKVYTRNCRRVEIVIKDSLKNRFVTPGGLFSMVQNDHEQVLGKPISGIDLDAIEKELKQIKELESAEVFYTVDGVLHVEARQRDPVMRIISSYGNSYYIDNEGVIIPHTGVYTPRVIIVSGSISVPDEYISRGAINIPDDNIISQLFELIRELNASELWSGQFEQVWVTEKGDIELIPRVGNQLVKLGSPEKVHERLQNLEAFYLGMIDEVGWNKYSEINLMFEGQIVCKKR